MSKVSHALLYSLVTTYLGKFINLFLVIAIVRLLSPDELGVYAIAAAFVMIVNSLKSFGVGNYLIKTDNLSTDNIRSALGLNIIISGGLGLIILAISIPLERFYDQPGIALLLCLMSINFFITPHTSNGMALLARNFRFKDRFKINLIIQIVELIAVIVLILLGFSYFSIVLAVILKYTAQMILLSFFKPDHMQWKPRFTEMRHIAKFGIFVTFSSMFERLTITCNDLIIGKLGNPSMVAYFSRGVGFIDFLNTTLTESINPVTMPYLSDQKRMGLDLQTAYYKASALFNAVLPPALLVAGVASYPVIYLFFGEQWVESAKLVSILCFWGVFNNIHALSPSLLMAAGAEKALFVRNMVICAFTALAVYFAFPYGLTAIAYAITATAALNFIYTTVMIRVLLGFSLREFLRTQFKNILLGLACFGAATGIDLVVDFNTASLLLSFTTLIIGVGATWLAILAITRHSLLDEGLKLIKRS